MGLFSFSQNRISGVIVAFFIIIGLITIGILASLAPDPKTAEGIKAFEKPLLIIEDFPDVDPYLIVIGTTVLTVWIGPAIYDKLFGQKAG